MAELMLWWHTMSGDFTVAGEGFAVLVLRPPKLSKMVKR